MVFTISLKFLPFFFILFLSGFWIASFLLICFEFANLSSANSDLLNLSSEFFICYYTFQLQNFHLVFLKICSFLLIFRIGYDIVVIHSFFLIIILFNSLVIFIIWLWSLCVLNLIAVCSHRHYLLSAFFLVYRSYLPVSLHVL